MKTSKVSTIHTNVRRFAAPCGYSLLAIALIGVCSPRSMAQASHAGMTTMQNETAQAQQAKTNALVKIVQDSTERFKDVNVAIAEGYALQFGCVSGDSAGAMGLHYVNANLVSGGVLDATHPQIVIYEAAARRKSETDRRRLSVDRRHVEQEPLGPTAADGTTVSFVRQSQPFRAPCVLHAARLGVERQSQWRVRELAPERFLPVIRRPNSVSQ